MSDPLLTSSADGVREMRLNRPEKRNAITYAMYEALYRGLTGAQADETVRVVLLTGEGAAFCAGNDLNDFLNGPEFSSEHPVMGFLHTLATFEKPQGALLETRRLLRGEPAEIRARIDAEARIFGAQLRSEEFRTAISAFLARGRAAP